MRVELSISRCLHTQQTGYDLSETLVFSSFYCLLFKSFVTVCSCFSLVFRIHHLSGQSHVSLMFTIHCVTTVLPEGKRKQFFTCAVRSGCQERFVIHGDKVHLSIIRDIRSKELRLLESNKGCVFMILIADRFSSEAIKQWKRIFPKNEQAFSSTFEDEYAKF